MTGSRGNRARLVALALTFCAAAATVGWAASVPAVAAPPTHCVTGTLQGNNPAHPGDFLYAVADVNRQRCGSSAHSIEFRGGGQVLYTATLTSQIEYQAIITAFPGLTNVIAVVSRLDGSEVATALLGTVTVVGATTTPPPHSSTPAPPVSTARTTVTNSAGSGRSSSATATKSKSTTPHAPATIHIPDYGGDSASDSATDTATPTATTSSSDSAVGFPVDVIHGSGSVNPIPSGLIAVAIVVIAGVLGAAVRFIYLNNRGDRAS